MAILIDGYNLLHATGFIPAGRVFASLEGPRREFLLFLARQLTVEEAGGTTVVFDAAGAPAGLPRRISFRGIQVLFAHNHAEADDLIEDLIQSDPTPRKLTVVSSDHRLHRAARRRRATVVDSDQWYWQIHERPPVTAVPPPDPIDASRDPVLDEAEVAQWLAAFEDVEEEHLDVRDETRKKLPTASPETTQHQPSGEMENPFPPDYGKDVIDDEGDPIFPPGYGEDLLDEE